MKALLDRLALTLWPSIFLLDARGVTELRGLPAHAFKVRRSLVQALRRIAFVDDIFEGLRLRRLFREVEHLAVSMETSAEVRLSYGCDGKWGGADLRIGAYPSFVRSRVRGARSLTETLNALLSETVEVVDDAA